MHVTPEMRKAVFDELCATEGHIIALDTALNRPMPEFEPEDGPPVPVGPVQVLGPPGQVSHFHCARCGRVWMVIEDEAPNYEVAEQSLKNRMRRPESIEPRNKVPKKRPRPGEPVPDRPTPQPPNPNPNPNPNPLDENTNKPKKIPTPPSSEVSNV